MNTMIPLVETKMGRAITNSRAVADYFKKQHKDVLRTIKGLACSREFYERNFAPVTFEFTNGRGGTQTASSFDMTRDGWVFLAMGFTGPKADAFKEAYIARFNEMEQTLRNSHRTAYLGTVMTREFSPNGPSFEGVYADNKGETRQCFNLPKRETMILVSGYSIVLRARIVDQVAPITTTPTNLSHTLHRIFRFTNAMNFAG